MEGREDTEERRREAAATEGVGGTAHCWIRRDGNFPFPFSFFLFLFFLNFICFLRLIKKYWACNQKKCLAEPGHMPLLAAW